LEDTRFISQVALLNNDNNMTDDKSKETSQSTSIAQDSSEIFDACKQGVLKVTEELTKFQPQ